MYKQYYRNSNRQHLVIIPHPLSGLQNQPLRPILAILPYLVAFQHVESLVEETF